MDLRVRSLFGREGDDVLCALNLPPKEAGPKRRYAATPNDAAGDLDRERAPSGEVSSPAA